ncbi:MAG: rod shape-determining protein MreC [Bacilli bacterium]|nr:rod shape-determining protein MreC [Bacilli bacterium]
MHNNRKYIVLVILFIVAFLLCLTVSSTKSNRKLTFVESVVKDSTLFIGRVVYAPFGFVKDKINDFRELINVKKKYNKIKKDKDKIEVYKQEIKTLKQEINDLKELNGIDEVLSLYNYKNATVIARNYNTWYNSLTIDKGSKNGLKIGNAVTYNGILIGKISKLSNFTAEVQLLSADTLNNNISVELIIDDKEVYGILTRYDSKDKVYIVEGITDDVKIEVGTKVITSGLTDSFKKGIIIGEVDDLSTDSFDLTRILKVKPATNFDDINYVSVIIGEK